MEDRDSVSKVLGGDREAFGLLVRKYHRRLYYYILGKISDDDEAEDLVQKTFVTAFHRLRDFDPSQPLLPWLRGIALNHCRNGLRQFERQALLRERFLDARRASLHAALLDEPGGADERRIEALRKCVRTLSTEEQEALRLRFVEERPLKSIGEPMRKNAEAVRLFLFRIRQRLAECIRKRLAVQEGA